MLLRTCLSWFLFSTVACGGNRNAHDEGHKATHHGGSQDEGQQVAHAGAHEGAHEGHAGAHAGAHGAHAGAHEGHAGAHEGHAGAHEGHAGAHEGHADEAASKQTSPHAVHNKSGHKVLGHRFEDADEWAKRFENPARDAWQKPAEVVRRMNIEAGMKVADIGAGTGYFLPLLSQAVGAKGQVMGLDIEVDMVRYMTERSKREGWTNVGARVVEPGDPGLAAASTDRILIVDTWHHISERVSYAKKLAAALTPGGTVTVVDFTMTSPHGPSKKHRIKARTIIKELAAAGLVATAIKETLPNQYMVVGRLK